jgi:hypothetical protein
MTANVTRAWVVLAGLGALFVYGCAGDSRSNGEDADAGAPASGGSGDASAGDAGEAQLSGASGSGGRGGSATMGGSAGSVTGGTGGDVSGSAGTGDVPADECDTSEDCPPIECLVPPCPESVCALGSQGYRVCQTRDPLPVGNCTEPSSEACCATSDDCQDAPGGQCVPFSLGYCGGPAPPDHSTCRYDTCDSDSDCTGGEHGVCLIDYPRTCSYGPCRTSADCTEGPGGRCVMTRVGQPCPELAVFCTYDDDACASDADCPRANAMQQVCEPDADGHGRGCVPWQPPPP